MSISPKKHRPLSRVQSSPSLAVGIPVPYPDFDIMNPSSSTKSLKRSRSKPHIHRGDVSSSAASSPYNSEDEDVFNTPKRKVVGVIEPATVGRQKAGSRETLQARLQQAAKLKKSRSIGDGLGSSSSITHILEASQSTTAKVKATTQVHHGGESSDKSDKVVVCVRIKPTNSEFATKAYECTAASLSLSNSHPNVQKRGGKSGREDEYTYTFDKLLQYPSRTPDLYEAKIAPLVEKTMNGFNSTIFAYGQTGSGKSHTMTGTDSELGIIPCAVDGVFDSINAELDRAYLLRVSYIEIYNETLRDLLNFKKGPLKDEEKPVIHTAKGKVYVEPLVEQVVSTPQEVVELLAKGNACRKTGATDWNERSSRSHSVFTITVESRPRDGNGDDDIRVSRLNLIDLAGSEKAVSDLERRGEGKHINRSLLALREVINKLTEKKRTHVPYRDSKLTHLLENALGGDSNICVICTMSADEEHSSETLETLKFAGRCSQVETKAKKNIIMSDDRALIKAKDREIEVLKRRLDAIASASTSTSTSSAHDSAEQIAELADSVAAMEARKTVLSTKLARLNAEIITSEMPRSVAGLSATPIKPKRRRISEFAGPLGLGSPRRVVNDRRAVSNMSRLTEEVETTTATITTLESTISVSQSSSFDLERTIASLRRQLASKETELETLNDELTPALGRLGDLHEINLRIVSLESDIDMLQTDHAALLATKEANEEDHRSQMRDLQIQLESTRAELVGTISDKAAKMDQLESAILDLRQSREDLLVEDQQKLDEMTSRVEQLQRDKLQLEDQLKEGLGSKVELQSKFDSLVRDHSSAKESFEREASELRSTVEIVTQERDQASQVVLGLQDTRTKLQSEIDTLIATTKFTKGLHQTELAQAKDAVAVAIRENVDKSEVIRALQEQLARLQEEHNALQGAHETCQVDKDSLRHDLAQSILEKETAQRSRQEAQDDLERFQRASMAEETKVVAELREELAKARKAREEDTAKLQADLHGLERAIEEEKQLGASSLREAQKDKDAVLSQHALELERRDQLEKDSYRDAEDLRKLLKAATDEKAAAAGALEAYKREVQASESAIMAELRKELASAQTAREEAMAQLEKAESASTNALQSQGEHQRRVEEQLQASKQELEAERKQSEEMAQAHASEIASLKVLVTEGAAGIDQLQQQLKQSREDGSQLSAQSSKHLSDLERLRNELSTKLVAANEEKETLRQTMEDVKTELQQAQTALETDRSRLAEAAELSDSLRQKLESREQQFITNLQQIQQSVESQKRAHVEAERQLESTKAVLAEVSGSKDEMAGKVAALEIDCAALRGALDRSQTELVESQKTVAESAEKATALAKQVAELQASISVTTTDTRTRQTVSASEPSMRSTVVVETLRTPALTTASTGDGAHSPAAMLRTKENEEIDRLEKVVEAQKIVIEEQREKILYWSRELEQQREIVQRLTQDPNDRTPPSRLRSSPRLSHSKSRSVGGYDSPSALPATRKPFPSTFTAFNLALPTTPTPLPAHPTQISNSSSRKGRRLTIEHDIDKLADSSKVNLARAMFDQPSLQPQSPTKTPTGHKRTTSLLASAPRQRRP